MRKFYIGHTEIVFGCEMDRDAVIKAESVESAIHQLRARYKKNPFGMVTEISDITSPDQEDHFYIEVAEFS
jgi:hypothetical protein